MFFIVVKLILNCHSQQQTDEPTTRAPTILLFSLGSWPIAQPNNSRVRALYSFQRAKHLEVQFFCAVRTTQSRVRCSSSAKILGFVGEVKSCCWKKSRFRRSPLGKAFM